MIFTVIEKLENDNYLIGFEMKDGEYLGTKEWDLLELRATILMGCVTIKFLCEVEFQLATVEHYGGEFDVNVGTYTYNEYGSEINEKFIKTYKSFKKANARARKECDRVKLINCEIVE